MGRRWFAVAAMSAVTLSLLVAEASFAQVIVGIGGLGRPRGLVPVGSYYPYSGFGFASYGYMPFNVYPSDGYMPYNTYPNYGLRWSSFPTNGYYQTVTYSFVPTLSSGAGSFTGSATSPAAYSSNPVTNRTAFIEVRVPADAEVWFNGEKSSATGPERSFRSKPLEADKIYTFEVKARWKQDDKPVEKSRKVRLMAGEQVRITLLDTAS